MNKQLALKKQQELGIAIPQIVREEYEMVLLNRIFESDFGSDLVFRGGTALRLAYNSPFRIRDIFDLWFIGQKLGEPRVMDFSGFRAREIKSDLHKLLPQKQWKLIKEWLPKK